jgi:flagellar basal body-associated protein FliL
MNKLKQWALVLGVMLSTTVLAAGGGGGDAGGGNFLKLEPVIVNVKVGNGSGYLNFVPQLKLADPLDAEFVKAHTPILRHVLIKTLVGQDGTTLQSTEFMGSFSQKAAEILNKVLDGEYVKDVFFDRWVIQ